MNVQIKPRAYGEPISEDAPGFNPTVHKDLVEEINEAFDRIEIKDSIVGPANASHTEYDYRFNQDAIEFFDESIGVWRVMSHIEDDYKPGFKRLITATNDGSTDVLVRPMVDLITDKARSDGADIRIWAPNANGDYIIPEPFVMTEIASSGSDIRYRLSFKSNIPASSSKVYLATYGDPTAHSPSFSASQYSSIFEGVSLQSGSYYVSTDYSAGYVPDDATFRNAGTQIFGARDDVGSTAPITGSGQVIYDSVPFSILGHNSNGGLEFGTATASRPSAGPKSLGWSAGDLYESWRREVIMPNGYAWHILTGGSGYTANMMLTIRYYNTGRWTLTMFHNESTHTSRINCFSRGVEYVHTGSLPVRRDNPESWLVIDMQPVFLSATLGNEVAITGSYTSSGGLRPIYADSIMTGSGNVQDVLTTLMNELSVLQARVTALETP